jgi:hypothetical protein
MKEEFSGAPYMSHPPDFDELALPFAGVRKSPSSSLLSDFCTYLAFEAHAIRIGLELSCCVILFEMLNFFLLREAPGAAADWKALWSWFISCSIVLLIDQLVLCRPVYTFRKVYQLSLAGAYEPALQLLERIAPERRALVRCPKPLFHLLRAEILAQSETYRSAERELMLAEQAGASGERIRITRSRLLLLENAENAYANAHEEIRSARECYGDTAGLCLEDALLLLEEHRDLWEAKRILKRVCEMPDERHVTGEMTSQLAKAGLDAVRLWTGEAEEGLDGLNISIEYLRGTSLSVDTLRPFVALLHLERSLYLATHKEPELACFDLRMGLALCKHPNLRKKAEKIQDELAWRHPMTVPLS